MPGESILVVEDNATEREFAQGTLEGAGYRVISAGNAAAAMSFPEISKVSLIVMDSHLAGVSGFDALRLLRQQSSTHPIPVLLLIPEQEIDPRQDHSPRGANGYLVKPYNSGTLARKVERLLEEKNLDELADEYLQNAADLMMESLAENHIKAAIERKTQIIIERCIQNVASAIDQRARAQVNESVTTLSAEKEQELVKLTVREVAQSMVEKLAERKVTEAMETVLAEQAERTVKRIADQTLPNVIRERLKETLNSTLPREIQSRVQKAVEKEAPEIGRQLVATLEDAAGKVVPRVVREAAPEIIERKFREVAITQLPPIVRDQVSAEIQSQLADRLDPALQEAGRRLRRTVFFWNALTALVAGGLLAFSIYLNLYANK